MQLRQLLLQYEIENNIKHDEAAKRIGIGRATYFRWLKGESTHLKANTLKKLSDMLWIVMSKVFWMRKKESNQSLVV